MNGRLIHFTVLFLSITVFPSFALSVTFSSNDLEGTWYGHQIVTGDAPADDPRWGFGTATFDTSGNYTVDWTSPTQLNQVSTGAIQINANGVFTVDNQPLTHGIMNDTKNLMVFIDGTKDSGGNALVLLVKRTPGTSFNTNDLAGTWYGCQVVSGDAPADDPRWGYGTIAINGSGIFSANWTSPTQANEISTGSIQINTNGIFTWNNQPLTHGVMNDAKNLLVLTDGTSASRGSALIVLVKRAPGVNFIPGDLAGLWNGHHVVSGDASADDPRWGHGTVSIDSGNSFTANWTSPTSANEQSAGALSVSNNGIFTINNAPLTHGVISDSKDFFIFIDGSNESQGNALSIFFKHISLVSTGPNLLLLSNP